jgi:hypothetical protein
MRGRSGNSKSIVSRFDTILYTIHGLLLGGMIVCMFYYIDLFAINSAWKNILKNGLKIGS